MTQYKLRFKIGKGEIYHVYLNVEGKLNSTSVKKIILQEKEISHSLYERLEKRVQVSNGLERTVKAISQTSNLGQTLPPETPEYIHEPKTDKEDKYRILESEVMKLLDASSESREGEKDIKGEDFVIPNPSEPLPRNASQGNGFIMKPKTPGAPIDAPFIGLEPEKENDPFSF